MKKHNMSHNACSVYDYSKLRWNIQPFDMVRFWDREHRVGCVCVGEVVALTAELLHVRRLKDNRIFVISLYDISDWDVRPVDYVRRLPNGIFSVGEQVSIDGAFDLPGQQCFIDKFERNRVKIHCFLNGRSVCFFWVLESEVLKYEVSKTH